MVALWIIRLCRIGVGDPPVVVMFMGILHTLGLYFYKTLAMRVSCLSSELVA